MSSAALQVVVHVDSGSVTNGRGQDVVDRAVAMLRADDRVSQVVPPRPGLSVSRDSRTALIQAGAADANTNEMVRAADDLKEPLHGAERRASRSL